MVNLVPKLKFWITMLSSILIIVICAGLLLYWFRYTCILLVRNGAEEAQSFSAAAQSSFSFHDVQCRLGTAPQLDPLHLALQRDYEVLTYLVRHASGLAFETFEERLLVWDYKLMQVWYSATRIAAPEQARGALREMASVLMILAGRLGNRAGVNSEA
jgi:hypothetical protein